MKKIAIYGSGGYGSEVACLIKSINQNDLRWNFIGYFDDIIEKGSNRPYGKVLGNIGDLNNWDERISLVIAIGNPEVIQKIASKITNTNIDFPNLIAPNVIFHDRETVDLGHGNVIFFSSIISCYTKIGNFNLLNNSVFLGHNSTIGSFNVINPSVRISGNVTIGDVNFFGVSSIVLQSLSIGSHTKISAGSCLYRNTKDNHLYSGNPAVIRLTPKANN